MTKRFYLVTYFDCDAPEKMLEAMIYSSSVEKAYDKFITHFTDSIENTNNISVSDYFQSHEDEEVLDASNDSQSKCFVLYWMQTYNNLVVKDKYFYIIANSQSIALEEWTKKYRDEFSVQYDHSIEPFSDNIIVLL